MQMLVETLVEILVEKTHQPTHSYLILYVSDEDIPRPLMLALPQVSSGRLSNSEQAAAVGGGGW